MKSLLILLLFHSLLSKDVDVDKYNQLLNTPGDNNDTDPYEFNQYGQINRPIDKETQNKTDEAILQLLRNSKEEDKQTDKLRSVYNIIKQSKHNAEQEKAYKQHPTGSDYSEEIIEGIVYVKEVPRGLRGKPKMMDKYTLRLNSHTVYYSDIESGYRDIRGGMDLLSLVSDAD